MPLLCAGGSCLISGLFLTITESFFVVDVLVLAFIFFGFIAVKVDKPKEKKE